MIRSMTGFGHGEILKDNRRFTVEMKSVNHRYFDVNIRMPKSLGFFEAQIRETLKKYIHDSARLYEDKIDVNDPGNFRIHKVGATIGTYAGPGAIAVAFFAAKN